MSETDMRSECQYRFDSIAEMFATIKEQQEKTNLCVERIDLRLRGNGRKGHEQRLDELEDWKTKREALEKSRREKIWQLVVRVGVPLLLSINILEMVLRIFA